jgi:hypothetical protein
MPLTCMQENVLPPQGPATKIGPTRGDGKETNADAPRCCRRVRRAAQYVMRSLIL